MTFFHLINCLALALGPHVIYYKATPLSEYGTLAASVRAGGFFLATSFLKILLVATFCKVSEDAAAEEPYDPYQEVLKAAIGCLDVAGLYYALTQVVHRNISYAHRFQAVGLGWAVANALTEQVVPLLKVYWDVDFTWNHLITALESNASLVLNLSLAALGSLMWLRRNKPPALVPFIYAAAAAVTLMPLTSSYLRSGLHWDLGKVVAFELASAGIIAFVTWRLFAACQKPAT